VVIEAVMTRFFISERRDVLCLVVDFSVGVSIAQGVGINAIEADSICGHGRSHALVVDGAHCGQEIRLHRAGPDAAAANNQSANDPAGRQDV
jgi:hypothetical protein